MWKGKSKEENSNFFIDTLRRARILEEIAEVIFLLGFWKIE